jgi:hypothetical protein
VQNTEREGRLGGQEWNIAMTVSDFSAGAIGPKTETDNYNMVEIA